MIRPMPHPMSMATVAAAPPGGCQGRGIVLTEEQWNQLDHLRFSTPSADIFRNCRIILESDSRDTIASIAEDRGWGTDTVIRVRRLYRQGGVQALHPIKP